MKFLNYTETPQVLQFHGKDAAWLLGSKYDLWWCKHISILYNFGFWIFFFPRASHACNLGQKPQKVSYIFSFFPFLHLQQNHAQQSTKWWPRCAVTRLSSKGIPENTPQQVKRHLILYSLRHMLSWKKFRNFRHSSMSLPLLLQSHHGATLRLLESM